MIELYDYQKEDVTKLSPQHSLDASEMGTGKTFKAGAIADGRTLWIGPLPTLRGSRDKLIEMGHPGPFHIVDRKDRDKSWRAYERGEKGVFFVHWEALRLMPDLAIATWDHVIGDEIHRAQSRISQQTRALKKIKKVGHKLGMSGTPITGAADKYWSVLNWLYPKAFPGYWKFFNRYVEYKEVWTSRGAYKEITGNKNEQELLDIVDHFYVRHLKKEQCCNHHPEGVAPWLPDKYYEVINVELNPQQRRAYNEMRKDMLAWVGQNEDQPLAAQVAVAKLMRLQQFAVTYANMVNNQVKMSEPSTKLDALVNLIEDNPGKTLVVWSQFKQAIYLLETRLKAAGISCLLYTGDNTNIRDLNVKRFAEGGAQVFAGTIAAGGVGVDGLQRACSTVVFLDRLWNPALNQQAEDRLWRDGQANAVQVIDIMADDTVDLGRAQRLTVKWQWIRRILGDIPLT